MEIYAGTGLKSLRNKKHHQEYNPLPPTICLVSGYQNRQPSFNKDTSLSLPENYFISALALFSYIKSSSSYGDHYTGLTKSSALPKCFIRPFFCLHLIFVFPFSYFSFFFSPTQPLTLFIIIIKHSFALLTNWKTLTGGYKGGVSGL